MSSIPFPRRWLIVFLGIVVLAPAEACMNDYRPNEPNVPAIARSKSLFAQLTQHSIAEPWTQRRDRLRKLLAEGGDFRMKNDLATTLAHTGEATEAVNLLEEVEAEKPGLYFTAANLGTAYELSGDDRKALEWIRTGIERNPDAHEKTEWLHVRILEAKLAMAEDPKWLETHSILDGREPANGGRSATGNRGEKLAPEQVKAGLLYQLHERLQFVKPPDAVVGALLLDLGDLVAAEPVGPGGSLEIVVLAGDYLRALPTTHPLRQRADSGQLAADLGQSIPRPWWDDYFPVAGYLLVGGLLAFLVIALMRKIRE